MLPPFLYPFRLDLTFIVYLKCPPRGADLQSENKSCEEAPGAYLIVLSPVSNEAEHHALSGPNGLLYKREDVTKVEASTGVTPAKTYVLERTHCSTHKGSFQIRSSSLPRQFVPSHKWKK